MLELPAKYVDTYTNRRYRVILFGAKDIYNPQAEFVTVPERFTEDEKHTQYSGIWHQKEFEERFKMV